jgi:hypothetical protein
MVLTARRGEEVTGRTVSFLLADPIIGQQPKYILPLCNLSKSCSLRVVDPDPDCTKFNEFEDPDPKFRSGFEIQIRIQG